MYIRCYTFHFGHNYYIFDNKYTIEHNKPIQGQFRHLVGGANTANFQSKHDHFELL